MKKRYKVIVNGKTVYKNVLPENEEKFWKDYGQHDPIEVNKPGYQSEEELAATLENQNQNQNQDESVKKESKEIKIDKINLEDYPINSPERKSKYDELDWVYDDTIDGHNVDNWKKKGILKEDKVFEQEEKGKIWTQTGGFGESEESGNQVWEWVSGDKYEKMKLEKYNLEEFNPVQKNILEAHKKNVNDPNYKGLTDNQEAIMETGNPLYGYPMSEVTGMGVDAYEDLSPEEKDAIKEDLRNEGSIGAGDYSIPVNLSYPTGEEIFEYVTNVLSTPYNIKGTGHTKNTADALRNIYKERGAEGVHINSYGADGIAINIGEGPVNESMPYTHADATVSTYNDYYVGDLNTYVRTLTEPKYKEELYSYINDLVGNSLYLEDPKQFIADLNVRKAFYSQQDYLSPREQSVEGYETNRRVELLDGLYKRGLYNRDIKSLMDSYYNALAKPVLHPLFQDWVDPQDQQAYQGYGVSAMGYDSYEADFIKEPGTNGWDPNVPWESLSTEQIEKMKADPDLGFLFDYEKEFNKKFKKRSEGGYEYAYGVNPFISMGYSTNNIHAPYISPGMIENGNNKTQFNRAGDLNMYLQENSKFALGGIMDLRKRFGDDFIDESKGGYITLEDGTKISHDFIWKNKKDILQIGSEINIQKGKEKEKEKIAKGRWGSEGHETDLHKWREKKKDEVDSKHFSDVTFNGISSDGTNEDGEKVVNGEDIWREGAMYSYYTDEGQFDPYLLHHSDGKINVKIAKYKDLVAKLDEYPQDDLYGEHFSGGDDKTTIGEVRNIYANEMAKMYRQQGHQPLYDDDGNFIDVVKREWKEENGYNVLRDINGKIIEKVQIIGTMEDAEVLAEANDLSALHSKFNDLYYRLVMNAKDIVGNQDEVLGGQKNVHKNISYFKGLLGAGGDSWMHDMKQIMKVAYGEKLTGLDSDDVLLKYFPHYSDKDAFGYDLDDDLPYLTKISGTNDLSKKHNALLNQLVTTYLAIRINTNPVKLPVEGVLSEMKKSLVSSFTGEDYDPSKLLVENVKKIWVQTLNDLNYDVPENTKVEESFNRQTFDRITGGIFDIAQLTVAVAVGNRALALGKGFKLLNAWVNRTKTIRNASKTTKLITQCGLGALATTTQFTAGEQLWSVATGNEINMTLYQDENGEWVFHPTIAVALGAGMPMWTAFKNAMNGRLMKASTNYARLNSLAPETVKKVVSKAGSGVLPATIIAVPTELESLLKTGEWSQTPDNISHYQAFLESIIMFSSFGMMKGGVKEYYEAAKVDVLKLKGFDVAQYDGMNTLGIKKNQRTKDGIIDYDLIENTANNKKKEIDNEIKKVEESNISAEKKGEKITELENKKAEYEQAKKDLNTYNLYVEAKTIAKKENNYGEFLQRTYIDTQTFNNLIRNPENLTIKEIELIGNSWRGLRPEALSQIYSKLGWKEGSVNMLHADFLAFQVMKSVHKLDMMGIETNNLKRQSYLRKNLEVAYNQNKINILKNAIEKNPESKTVNTEKIKRIEKENKELREETHNIEVEFAENFKGELKRENDYLKLVLEGDNKKIDAKIEKIKKDKTLSVQERNQKIAKLNADKRGYNAVNTNKFKNIVKKEGGIWEEGMFAFISKDGKRIYVDQQRAFKEKSISDGMHDGIHMMLYNHLKTINSKGQRVLSKKGIATIDRMLDLLPGGRSGDAYQTLKKIVETNYKYKVDVEASKKESLKRGETTIIFEKDKNGKRIETPKEEYYEEYVTKLGQLIRSGKIESTENLGTRLGKAFYPIFKKVGPFKGMYEFDIGNTNTKKAGTDLLKFVEWVGTKGFTENVLELGRGKGFGEGISAIAKSKDIHSQISKLKPGSKKIVDNNNTISEMLIKRAKEKFGDNWKKILDSDTKEYKTEKKEFVEETSDLRNAIVKNNENVAHTLASHPKYGGKGQYKGITGDILVGKDKFFEKFENELYELSRTYNPAKGTPVGAYLFETIRYRYPKIMEQLAPETRTRSITTEDGKILDVKDIVNYERFESENILEIELKKQREKEFESEVGNIIPKSKLRKEIDITDAHKNEILKKVEVDIRLAEAPIGKQKDFLKSLNKVTENTHYNILSKLLPKEKMLQHKNVILESIPISQLVQMGKFLPQGNIFVKEHTHPTKTKWSTESNIQEFMGIRPEGGFIVNKTGKNLLPEMRNLWDKFSKMPLEKQKASPEYIEYKKKLKVGFPKIFERLEVGQNAWKEYLEAATRGKRQIAAKSGTKGNNRDNIIRKLSTALTKDAIPELLADKNVVEKYMDSKNLKEQIEAKALIERFVNNIDRAQGLQFSKEIKTGDLVSSGEQSIRGMFKVVNKIAEVGVQNVYDFTPVGKKFEYKLKEEYENWISNTEAKFVFERLILENKVFNKEGNVTVEKILEGIDAGRKRSLGFEQFIINQFKGIEGLELITEKQTEKGDMADVPAKIAGKDFFVEVKMPNGRLGSYTGSHNIVDGTSKTTTKDFSKVRDRAKIESLQKESLKGWRKIRSYYKKLSKLPGISSRDKILLENFNKHSDAVPEWAFEAAKEAKLYNQARSRGIFTETLVEDMYKYKTNPSEYMLMLGKGLLHLGKNKFGLETTKLEGEFFGEWGHSKSSIRGLTTKHEAFKTKENPTGKIDGSGLITTSLRFIPTIKNITSKNSKINVTTKKGLETLNNGVNNAKKVIEAENNYKAQVTASKSIENTIKLVNGKVKRKGKSTFDFDDTIGITKSGVRYKQPNPSGEPAPQRKVIFLAGSAGSGKSNVVKQLGLEKQGFKIVNQDISLEWLAKNSGLPSDMRNFTPEQSSKWGSLQWKAREIAQNKQMKFKGRGDGIVVDGTGASKISMQTQVMKFKNAGYDVQMLFVESSLETALNRNKARKERSLKDFIVERTWNSVQANKKAFKEDFKENFVEINTDRLKQGDPIPQEVVSKMDAFTKGYIKGRLTAEEFANRGDGLKKEGAEFDFSEFNEVVDGKPGPFLEKLRERIKQFGNEDVFILTARPQQSAKPIQEFLESQGIKVKLENITGLANSSGNAKAKWILEKFAEGYNDMYFVDDALQNVKAVKKVLEQLDVKSKVVQAKMQFSKDINSLFNKMLERKSKIPAGRKISLAEAKIIGKGKGRFDYFVPPSAEDLKGLMYKFLGKGRQGDADMKFFKESLFDPFAKGIRNHTIVKQKMVEEYKTLKKNSKDIKLNKEIEGTVFDVDAAVRVYLWDKAGHKIPELNETVKEKLLDYVNNNPKLISFAETLGSISRSKEGYKKPGEYWMVEKISNDLNDIAQNQTRKEFLTEWIENKNILFSPENLNKIEAVEGKWFREALENMLTRMELGTNRLHGIKDGPTKLWYDWINGSVGATMFINSRSAMLQTISTINFTNMAENNIYAQAKAFANQKQFWKDFVMLWNSPMLKQRRAGLQIDVSASELTSVFRKSGNNPKSILKYILEKGFTPTRIADSFAIALGGSGFYRNRLNKYIKEGLSIAEARKKTMLDFQEIAEETQQSSRPDLISQQQAGPLGRLILAWQNTPMQMTRLMKKKLSDIVNRRRIEGQTQIQSDISNLMGIMYYGAIQNLWFGALQSGLGWMLFGSDLNDVLEKKEGKILNGAFDTLLRGTGVYGAAVSTFKNIALKYKEEKEKGWKKDLGNVIVEAINLSPPMGSKARKLYGALKTWDYNDIFGDVSQEVGLDPSNPDLSAIANIAEAFFNVPLARLVNKANNMEEAMTGNHEWWQNTAMILGWNRWNVGAKDEELEEAREVVKEQKKEEKKIEKEKEKEQKKKEKEQEKKEEEKEKKKKGIKTIRCSGTRSNGERCGNTTETAEKTWKCYHHAEFKDGMDRDGDGIKEYRCTAIKKNGDRCKNKTENKNKKCYAHQ